MDRLLHLHMIVTMKEMTNVFIFINNSEVNPHRYVQTGKCKHLSSRTYKQFNVFIFKGHSIGLKPEVQFTHYEYFYSACKNSGFWDSGTFHN